MELTTRLGMVQASGNLLQGCYIEATRSDDVKTRLGVLRGLLPEASRVGLRETIEEIRSSSRFLREIADFSQINQDRVPAILDPLNIVLPCLSRSLRDITSYTDNRNPSVSNSWPMIYTNMTAEAGGIPLPARFGCYNSFLESLRHLLTRSPRYQDSVFKSTRTQILRLREIRGIQRPAPQVNSVIRQEAMSSADADRSMNWVEKLFSRPLHSATALRHQHSSISYGPHKAWGCIELPVNSKALIRCPFNGDQISMTFFSHGRDGNPYLLLRVFAMGSPWFAYRGVHELCVDRGSTSLKFRRWSQTENRSKPWAYLYFKTWEELVLVHSTFLSLKARNNLTVQLGPEENLVQSEQKLCKELIMDDDFQHYLIVYEDRNTRGIRLLATVSEEGLRGSPVWTAFVTHQAASPTWMKRVSRHKIHLADVQVHVFCGRYRQRNQRRGVTGAFELDFLSPNSANRFEKVFRDLRRASAHY